MESSTVERVNVDLVVVDMRKQGVVDVGERSHFHVERRVVDMEKRIVHLCGRNRSPKWIHVLENLFQFPLP